MKQEDMQVVGTPATTDAQKSSVLWGVPDDVLVLLKQYNFEGHDAPTYTVTGSPNGLHFIVVWPTKDSNLGDKVLQDIMEIHQITQRETKEISTQTDSAGFYPKCYFFFLFFFHFFNNNIFTNKMP